MIHNYISNDTNDTNNITGDHYGVSVNSHAGLALVQLQSKGEQVRLALNPVQARHMAALLIKNASMIESGRQIAA